MSRTQTAPHLAEARQELARAIAAMNLYLMQGGLITTPEYRELTRRLSRAQRRVDRLAKGPV